MAALTTDHPYRERLSGFHMLALYRSGRQTEALRAYDRTRAILSEELGIEPARELQSLHHQILDHSFELDVGEPDGGDRLAFLATDIEASTAMWEAEPDEMQLALTRHDAILESVVTSHGGRIFKRTGDGIFAVFGGVRDAADAAADAQVALHAEHWETSRPLRARMGVDQGAATPRGDDYFGPVLNRVSRIMASAHGGQVVVPAEMIDRLAAAARSLGDVDFRGVGRIEVAQLEIDGLPRDFPDLRTDRAPSTATRSGFGRAIRGFELRERLGAGAHGVVYRAYQAAIGREVAVKVIRPELANRSDFVRRFESEAQFIAQLEHPHIVSMYDYWRDPDGAYLVMQLLRGGGLAASLERAPWRPPAALHLLDQVGSALDYAHRQGIIHRDLKPGNVLLDDEGNAYLTDFGIAAQHVNAIGLEANGLEATGLPSESSAAYVSPEELAGAPSGTATDVYGMTLLACEILTGGRPALGAPPPPIADAGRDLPAALDEVFARGAHRDPDARYSRISDLLRALRHVFGAEITSKRFRDDEVEARNPFKGLRAFTETDAADFAGRADLVDELVAHVASRQLTIVVGPSGCGKSSLVRAGLIPAARRGALSTAGQTLVSEMYPGSFPFEELESALLRVSVERPDDLLSDLLSDERGLLRATKQILPDNGELLLVIDQFEELFSLTTDERLRHRFLQSLATVAADERSRVRVVATLRADYLDRPLAVADFGSLVADALLPVPIPAREELARAIVDPATAAELDFEGGLIPRIIDDVVDQPGALPLMQYALTELVEARDGLLLTAAAYERIGGVTGALATRAEEIYEGLSPSAQEVTREVFLRLVRVSDEADDTRRRVRRTELEALRLGEANLDLVLNAYGAFRLLTFDRDPVTRGPTIEVAHEALIREWPRFEGWIDERREDLLMERRLELAAADWVASDRDPSFLYSAGRLEQYERWKQSSAARLTDVERQFLDDGRDAEDERNATAGSRRRRVLVAVSSLAALALLLAGIALVQRNDATDKAALAEASADDARRAAELTAEASLEADDARLEAQEQATRANAAASLATTAQVEAEDARAEADASRTQAVDRAFDAETDRLIALSSSLGDQNPRAAMLLATAVYQRDPSPAALGAVQESLVRAAPMLQNLASGTEYLDVDWVAGDRVAATHSDGIDLIDLATGGIVDSIPGRGAFRVPDFKRTTTDESGNLLAVMTDIPDEVADLPDLVDVSAYRIGADGFERLFDPVPLEAVGLNISMSPAGDMIVATGATLDESVVRALSLDGTELWVARFPRPASMFDQVSPVLGDDFSDADLFKTSQVGAFTTVTGEQVFVANGAWIHRLDHDGVPLGDRIFVQGNVVVPGETPGGRVVFDVVETDGGWYVFDAVGGTGWVARESGWPERLVIRDPDAARATVGSSSDITARVVIGDRVVATQRDGSLVLFDLIGGQPLSTTELRIGRPNSLSVAPGKGRLAIAHSFGVTIVALDDSGPLATALPRERSLIVLPISNDGALALLSPPGRRGASPVEIWNIGPDGPTLDPDNPIDEAAVLAFFLGADSSLVVTREPGVVNMEIAYSLGTGNELWTWEGAPGADAEASVADGPYGALRAFGGIDGSRNVEVYRLGEFEPLRVLESPYETERLGQRVLGLAFDPSGNRLLVADDGGRAQLWNLGSWTTIDDDHLATLDITLGTWSSDGTLAATAAPDGTISIRDGETFEARQVLTGAGHVTHPHPLIFSPDNSLLLTAFDGSGRLWDVETGSQIGIAFPQLAGTIAGMNVNEDGLRLMTASEQSALIWNLDTSAWADIACRAAGSNLTAQEWERWGPRDAQRYAIRPDYPLPA